MAKIVEELFSEVEFELLDEELEIKKTVMGRWCKPLKMFLQSGKKSMIYKCKTHEDQTRGLSAINTYKRNYNLPIITGRHGSTEIYVVRA